MAFEDILITNEKKEAIKNKAPDKLPLNPTAQGYSGQQVRAALAAATTGNQDSILSELETKLGLIKGHFETFTGNVSILTSLPQDLTGYNDMFIFLKNQDKITNIYYVSEGVATAIEMTVDTLDLDDLVTTISELQVDVATLQGQDLDDRLTQAETDIGVIETTLPNKADLVDGKILVNQLPDAIFDSLYFYGTVGGDSNLSVLAEDARDNAASIGRNFLGYYWVATEPVEYSGNTTPQVFNSNYYITSFNPAEEGISGTSGTLFLETGDWMVITKITGEGTSANPYVVTFAAVNNTYEDATTAIKGITQLSDAANYSQLGGNDVVTETVLKNVVDEQKVFVDNIVDGTQTLTDTRITNSATNVEPLIVNSVRFYDC
jgi:hypothetical protein